MPNAKAIPIISSAIVREPLVIFSIIFVVEVVFRRRRPKHNFKSWAGVKTKRGL